MDTTLYIPERGQLAPVPTLREPDNSCSTFTQPALDGSLCISEIYEWHAKYSPNHPVFQYLDDDGTVATINFVDTVKAMHRGGWLLRTAVGQQTPAQERRPVIAMIALSGICLTDIIRPNRSFSHRIQRPFHTLLQF
jgi:hypothetical protein